MSPSLAATHTRAARAATSVLFFAHGAMAAAILPRLPAIRDSLGLTNAELGAAIAALPVGGLIAGGFAGFLIARFGSGRLAIAAGIAATIALASIGLASSWAMLAALYLVLGMFDATMDAAMNANSIGVQRVYGRSILQGFHGLWSIGGITAGALGAVAAGLAIPVAPYLAAVGLSIAVALVVASRFLLPRSIADAHPETDGVADEPVHLRHAGRLLRVLFPIAMLGILCIVVQSAAAIWGAVYLTDVLGLAAGVAGAGFVVYIAAMAAGRLTNDRWIDRIGATTLTRIGAAIAAGGVGAAILAAPLGVPLLAYAGFAAIGYGTSSMFPVMVMAAGSRPGIPTGHGVALVSWLVRLGLVFAPTVVGIAADEAGLAAGFLIPLAAAVAIVALAVPLTGGRPRRPAPESAPAG
ncbi:MAG TPA: MFS transporter [Candidatus Limnocylindrales bacterium]|nr:MFS transporter [Candidatus Limnocylindrales bacterium]